MGVEADGVDEDGVEAEFGTGDEAGVETDEEEEAGLNSRAGVRWLV